MSFFRFDDTVNTAQGVGLSGVEIYVCTQPANTSVIPPSPLATIYSDSSGTPLANPVLSDGLGNYFFYTTTGTYTIVVFDPLQRIETQIFPDQQVVSPGGGSVSSIALTAPAGFSVSGSPITSSGTLGLSYSSDWNANTFLAGPTSGGASTPTRRALVTADLPAGVGSVSSVAETITAGALFSASISGSPITTSGTLGINIDFAAQSPNTFLAGPASGSSPGPVTARAMIPADLPGALNVTDAASVAFNAASNNSFFLTLSQNTTLSAISNGTKGQRVTICITQNATGGWTFSFPSTVKGWSNIGTDANSVSLQDFLFDGANWRATGPGSINAS
jgi:hypothetical protein